LPSDLRRVLKYGNEKTRQAAKKLLADAARELKGLVTYF
jgi:hypothetical protein